MDLKLDELNKILGTKIAAIEALSDADKNCDESKKKKSDFYKNHLSNIDPLGWFKKIDKKFTDNVKCDKLNAATAAKKMAEQDSDRFEK